MTERDQDCALLENLGETEMATEMETEMATEMGIETADVLIVLSNLRFPYKLLRLLRQNHRGEDVIVGKLLLVKEGSFSLSFRGFIVVVTA